MALSRRVALQVPPAARPTSVDLGNWPGSGIPPSSSVRGVGSPHPFSVEEGARSLPGKADLTTPNVQVCLV